MVSNKVKRNISATLTGVGILCIIGRVWDVIVEPHSAKYWVQLCGIIITTYLCFDSYLVYRRQVTNAQKKL